MVVFSVWRVGLTHIMNWVRAPQLEEMIHCFSLHNQTTELMVGVKERRERQTDIEKGKSERQRDRQRETDRERQTERDRDRDRD